MFVEKPRTSDSKSRATHRAQQKAVWPGVKWMFSQRDRRWPRRIVPWPPTGTAERYCPFHWQLDLSPGNPTGVQNPGAFSTGNAGFAMPTRDFALSQVYRKPRTPSADAASLEAEACFATKAQLWNLMRPQSRRGSRAKQVGRVASNRYSISAFRLSPPSLLSPEPSPARRTLSP